MCFLLLRTLLFNSTVMLIPVCELVVCIHFDFAMALSCWGTDLLTLCQPTRYLQLLLMLLQLNVLHLRSSIVTWNKASVFPTASV